MRNGTADDKPLAIAAVDVENPTTIVEASDVVATDSLFVAQRSGAADADVGGVDRVYIAEGLFAVGVVLDGPVVVVDEDFVAKGGEAGG